MTEQNDLTTPDGASQSTGPTADGADAARAATPREWTTAPVDPAPSTARRSGRPVLGAIAGFFLGLFLWLDLVLLGVIAFESITFWIFPVIGLAAGIALARWAPLGRRPSPA